MSHGQYKEYRDSAIEWLGRIPAHWDVRRLKFVASYRVSSVDKVAAEGEVPVRLCNYTDVYYNERIIPSLTLMETTATADELRRFGLQAGDVLLTKDSEDWSDIGVPAFVAESASDMVCGYHLAIVRPNPGVIEGEYLFRVLQSCAVNQQFQVAAQGVTRYGLPKSAIGDAMLPIPPHSEQKSIIDFLNQRTKKIDRLGTLLGSPVALLVEYRKALITAAVTGKIDVREAATSVDATSGVAV